MKTKHTIIVAARSTTLGINEIMPVALYTQSRGFCFFGKNKFRSFLNQQFVCLRFVKSVMVTIKYDLSY